MTTVHTLRNLTTSIILLAFAAVLNAADYYVAPNANGNGTIASPWSLSTALSQPSAVKPGDTIWLRGGTYTGTFTSYLKGAPGAPIVVRQYPGERAIIDGSSSPGNSSFNIGGSWTWFWGFEVMNSDPTRILSAAGSLGRGPGVVVNAPNIKIINLVVHDTGQGISFWSPALDSELYGNVIFYNGWDGPDRGHGHGIYVQNQNGAKVMAENIIFDQFSYGIHAYTETGYINNLTFDGNVSFNNGLPSFTGFTDNILLLSTNVALNPVIQNNYTYYTPAVGRGLNQFNNCSNASVNNNYFASGNFAISLPSCTPVSMAGNTFVGSTPGWTGSAYPSNAYYATPPGGVKVFVRPNKYEPGRGNITVFNWDRLGSVAVDLSGAGLKVGDAYEIRDVQNFLGAPVVSGTYQGIPVAIPMTGLSKARPIGNVAVVPAHSAPEFGAFIVLPRGGSGGVSTGGSVSISVGPKTAALSASQTQQFTATVAGSSNTAVTWSLNPATGTISSTGLYTAPSTVSGPQTVTVLATSAADPAKSDSATVNLQSAGAGGQGIRVNAGGQAYTDTQGRLWSTDFGYSGTGGVYTTPNAILGTSDGPLYQSERWTWPGALQYQFTAPVGSHTVNLKFAENYSTGPGQRVFNIVINGQTVASNFDIFAQAGGANKPVDKQFTVTSSGSITIQFTPVVGGAKVNAIEILPQSSPATPVSVTLSPGSSTLSASQTQQFNAVVAGSTDTSVRWSLNTGAVGTLSATGLYTAPSSIQSSQTVTVTATSNADPGKSANSTVTLQPAAPVNSSFTPIRVNAGGQDYTDTQGRQWSGDFGYSGTGGVYTTPNAILGTSDGPLYQSERWTWPGALQYQFTVPVGNYTVNLKFAENYATGPGQRVFNIVINGQTVASNFDIFAQAGGANKGTDKQFTVSSSGGITIQFTPVVGGPKVSAIEILQQSSLPAPVTSSVTAIRVNAGGPAYTDTQGRQWSGDFGYSGTGGVYTTPNAILGTSDGPLYQSERWTWPGALQYQFTVPVGSYTVNLKFAENYATGPGQRVFNIVINGQTVASNFDIFAQAGGANKGTDKQFTVSSSGSITIQFTPVVGGPKVNAIEIF